MSKTNNIFEMSCPNCGISIFEIRKPTDFYAICCQCEWENPNPLYKSLIDDAVILNICKQFFLTSQTPDEVLASKFTEDEIMSKMEKLHFRRLIEYGVSLRTAWLTDKGEALLNKLNQ